MTTPTLTIVHRPDGFHWHFTYGDAAIWDATPFPSLNAATADALAMHERYRRSGNSIYYDDWQHEGHGQCG